ncbi:three-prime repair exonuclease 1-like [Ptychodera flava]|uniref:three-prime repair exonuclease 1-like n=1 Tax=Ptychodera flava TaxID=63121 RepID=UPI003969EB86
MSLKRKGQDSLHDDFERNGKFKKVVDYGQYEYADDQNIIQIPPIKTFVFFDIEATGLPDPDGTLPDMTELSMVAVSRKSLEGNSVNGCIPRILDKLTLCLTPERDVTPTAEQMTGLSKPMLGKHDKRPMDTDVDGVLRYFIRRQAPPVCLVAHAGDRFDFPVLWNELAKVDSEWSAVYTVDSLKFFQQHMPKQNRSLPELCRRFLQFETDHDAEGDVMGLIRLVSSCRFADSFLEWAQENVMEFSL